MPSNSEPEVISFQCDACGKSFRKKRFVKQHIIVVHQKAHLKPTVKCDICGKLFKSRRDMRTHRLKHEFSKKLKCKVCENFYENKELLEEHITSTHTFSGNDSQLCDDKKQASGRKTLLPCAYCGRTFTTKYWLNVHVDANHRNGLVFVCEVCECEFQTDAEAKFHIEAENHITVGPKLKSCADCCLEFESRLRYRRHLAEIHCVGFACDLCPLVLDTPEELLVHSTPHPRKKYFKCEYCTKNFTSSSDFRKHVRIHTGQTPHMCEICGKKFLHKTKLTGHKKTHFVDKKYVCGICGAECSTTKDARQHRLQHST